MSIENEREQQEKIIELMKNIIQCDVDLREKYQVNDKFRFVPDRLNALLKAMESKGSAAKQTQPTAIIEDHQSEVVVYVYLYNSKGMTPESWQPMLAPKLFYEYSINRPIYAEKGSIEALIRSKLNRTQHGYLAVKVTKEAVLTVDPSKIQKDSLGQPLLKIKEGSLDFNRLISFTYNHCDYQVNQSGVLVKPKFGS